MNERQLRALKYVIEHGTTIRAAELMHVTQPAISRMLSTLEEELGIRLLERRHGRISPTPQARYFLSAADNVLDAMGNARRRAETIKNTSVGQLRVATMPGLGLSLLPQYIAEFQTQHPEIHVAMQSRTSPQVRDLVAAQMFDIGLAEPPWPSDQLQVHAFRVPCVCVFQRDDPLAQYETIRPEQIAHRDMALLNADHLSTLRLHESLQAFNATPNIVFECNLYHSAMQYVMIRRAITITDQITANSFPSDALDFRPLSSAIGFDVAVLQARSSAKQPEYIRQFLMGLLSALEKHAKPVPI